MKISENIFAALPSAMKCAKIPTRSPPIGECGSDEVEVLQYRQAWPLRRPTTICSILSISSTVCRSSSVMYRSVHRSVVVSMGRLVGDLSIGAKKKLGKFKR